MSSHRTGLLKESEHSSLSCTSIEIVCDFTLAMVVAAVNHKIANVKFILKNCAL